MTVTAVLTKAQRAALELLATLNPASVLAAALESGIASHRCHNCHNNIEGVVIVNLTAGVALEELGYVETFQHPGDHYAKARARLCAPWRVRITAAGRAALEGART